MALKARKTGSKAVTSLFCAIACMCPSAQGQITAPPQTIAAEPDPRAWHIRNTKPVQRYSRDYYIDLNVTALRQQVTGKGCRVTVVEHFSPDDDGSHADIVAGLVNGSSPDGRLGLGIATDSSVTIHDISKNASPDELQDYHVINNSFQTPIPYFGSEKANSYISLLGTHGRNGMGSLIFTSAGNRTYGYYEKEKLLPEVMNIGSVTRGGHIARSSARASYVFAAAPGENIFTGRPDEKNAFSSGTSFSSPLAASIGCLMLEANPFLTARDVQDIIALTSRRKILQNVDFSRNASTKWNGGGYAFNASGAGFGLVDATAAVRLAESWDRTSGKKQIGQRVTVTAPVSEGPSNNKRNVTKFFNKDSDIEIDHISLSIRGLDFMRVKGHLMEDDVQLLLTSPSGTTVPVFIGVPDAGFKDEMTYSIETGTSTHYFRGESLAGTWTLTLVSPHNDPVSLKEWRMNVTGRAKTKDSIYVYTSDLKDDNTSLSDPDGGRDTIHTTPVSNPVTLRLDGSGPSFINDKRVMIASNTIESVYTGDGDDTIYAGDGDGTIMPGRGDDKVYLGSGKTNYIYRPGVDGKDRIFSTKSTGGAITLRHAYHFNDVHVSRSGRDVLIEFENRRGFIRVHNWSPENGPQTLQLESNGKALLITDALRRTSPPSISFSPRP